MAKSIGLKTLAEGVETEEQYLFLREIGCERVQGYYFSEPKTYDELLKICDEKQIAMESRKWKKHYDKVGKIDLMSDRSLAIVEYDGANYTGLFANQEYCEVVSHFTDGGFMATVNYTNQKGSPIYYAIRQLQLSMEPNGRTYTFGYTYKEKYLRLYLQLLSRVDNKDIVLVEIVDLTQNENDESKRQLDRAQRRIYNSFDAVYLYNIDTMHVDATLKEPAFVDSHNPNMYDEHGKFKQDYFIEQFIYIDDQMAYRDFINPQTKLKRIKDSQNGTRVGYFRTKEANGSYVWKVHIVHDMEELSSILYTISTAHLLDGDLMKRLDKNIENVSQVDFLWRNFIDSRVLNVFWKNKNRQFVHANNQFLKTFGLQSTSQITGKTAEEMKWNVNPQQLLDEQDVFNKGVIIQNRVEKCLIRGMIHDIVISKEPIYHNHEIVGLVGYFVDAERIASGDGEMNHISMRDPLTNLLSSYGVMNTITTYINDYKTRHQKFALAQVSYGFYHRSITTYGEKTTNEILMKLGEIYADELSHLQNYHVTGGRLYTDTFILMAKYNERQEVEKMVQYLQEKSGKIHELCGVSVSFTPSIKLYFCDEHSSEEMISFATNTIAFNESLPGAVLVYRADASEEILYASQELIRLFECEDIEELKKMTGNSFKGIVHPDDLEKVERDIITQIRQSVDEKIDYVEYRIQTAKGNVKYVQDYGKLVDSPMYGKSYFVFITEKHQS